MKELFGHSCLGYCYAYLGLKTDNVKELTEYFMNGWLNGYIDDDGFVSKPIQYLKSVGIKCKDITKPTISQLSQLPEGEYAVEYRNPAGGSHFVVANKKGVIFDPSYPSNSVKNNIILSYRKFI